jgi:hypothetical protein
MINLFFIKYQEFNKFCEFNKKTKFKNNYKINDKNRYEFKLLRLLRESVLLSKLMPNVNAISIDSNHNKSDENFDQSKELKKRSIEDMTVWESIKYQLNKKKDINSSEINYTKEDETGWDRLKLMWTEWANGEDNPEVRFIMSSMGWAAIVGAGIGGTLGNKSAVSDFIRRHNEYVFRGEFEAKRRITDTMFIQFFKAGFRLSWRLAFFTGLLTGLTTTAIVYRNNVYYSDCMTAGALVCAFWKMKLGLRAMAVSAVVGSVLGFLFAGSIRLAMWTFNTNVPEYRHWRHTRYLGHITVKQYKDGTSEFDWNIDQSKGQ